MSSIGAIILYDETTLTDLERAEGPKQILEGLRRLSEENQEQLAAAVTLQSTLEETRLAAIQIMTVASEQTRREQSPRVREGCDIVLTYLQQLQTAVANATCPQDIDGGFLYGSDTVCLPDMDDVDNGLLVHTLLTYREGSPIACPSHWKKILQTDIARLLQEVSAERERYASSQ